MDKLLNAFEGMPLTDDNRWLAVAILLACIVGLALLPWLRSGGFKRRRRKHRDML